MIYIETKTDPNFWTQIFRHASSQISWIKILFTTNAIVFSLFNLDYDTSSNFQTLRRRVYVYNFLNKKCIIILFTSNFSLQIGSIYSHVIYVYITFICLSNQSNCTTRPPKWSKLRSYHTHLSTLVISKKLIRGRRANLKMSPARIKKLTQMMIES